MRGAVLVAAAGLLAACAIPDHAPNTPGVCWIQAPGGDFTVFSRGIANMETCAARLEVRWLETRQPVLGAFGGAYIFLDAVSIRAAARRDWPQELLLRNSDRARIDAAILALLKAKGGPS